MHVEKKFMGLGLITICWSRIMFITNMLSKKFTLWGGDAMVKHSTFQCEGQ
jgi:hypothetical protein